jgi:hypothetical protein
MTKIILPIAASLALALAVAPCMTIVAQNKPSHFCRFEKAETPTERTTRAADLSVYSETRVAGTSLEKPDSVVSKYSNPNHTSKFEMTRFVEENTENTTGITNKKNSGLEKTQTLNKNRLHRNTHADRPSQKKKLTP